MGTLGVAELRDDGQQAELVHGRAVHASDERTGQPLHERRAEPSAKERPDRHVPVEAVAGQHEVERPSGASRAARTGRS